MFLLVLLSAFSIFLIIAGFGFLFLVVSFIFGEIFEHGDFSAGHDIDMHGGPSFFSTRILSVFVTAFGCFGAIGINLGYGTGVSTALGLASGVVFGGIIYLFASFLYGQQSSSHVRVADLVGTTAQVSVAIPRGGLGQVRCTLGDNAVEKIARSKDGEEISANTLVKVESVAGEIVLVRRAE